MADMISAINAFKSKLLLWKSQLGKISLTHLPIMAKLSSKAI
jgi:hypothetical protein